MSLPLAGRRILVTRARHQAGKLSQALVELGAEVIELPVIEIVPPESYARLDRALQNLNSYQWLIVTSANTVRALAERMAALRIPAQRLEHLRIAAIGSATAEELQKEGLRASLVPENHVAEALVEAIRDRVQGARVLLARAAVARDVIPEELAKLGAAVDVAEAYRNVVPEDSKRRLRELISAGTPPDAVIFTSSSTATNFLRLLSEAGVAEWKERLRAISIGPITSATLREAGWEPAAEAEPHDIAGLVEAARRAVGSGEYR